jgi:hypothetical protein
MELKFYTYAYIRASDSLTAHAGTPYYIGKGSGRRAWLKAKGEVSPPEDKSLIVILESNLTEVGALAIERRLIAWYGRVDLGTGILRNKTDGGDGVCGSQRGIDRKPRKPRKPHKRKPPSPETRAKLSAANKGKVKSEEHKLKIGAAQKGRAGKPHTEETKLKMSLAKLGNKNASRVVRESLT